MRHLPSKFRYFVWGPLAGFLALAPLIITQIGQILSIVLLPISRKAFRRVNTFFAGLIWGYWAWALEKVNRTEVKIVGDSLPYREDSIIIANHQAMADVVALMVLARHLGSVAHLKWLVKDPLKYVPGVGWGMMFLDCVFLKRQWAKDETTIRKTFSKISENKLPVWLMSFPEGTRVTSEKLKRLEKRGFSSETPNYLLRPKAKGFSASVFGLRSHVKSIVSVTIFYHSPVPSLMALFRGDCPAITLHVRRHPIESLPADEVSLGEWLNKEFAFKNEVFHKLKVAP